MMTSGVQAAGLRTAGMAGAARAGSRASGDGSFADLMSATSSAKKETPPAASKTGQDAVRRPQTAENTSGTAKDGQQAAVSDKGSDQKLSEQGTVKEDGGDSVRTDGLQDGESGDAALSQPEGEEGLDTEFVKSLKLFREAARTLEAAKLSELKQAIMDSMQIDEEELLQLLEQFGTNIQGLLQPQLLQQLVVAVECKGDPMGLLTSEQAMNDLQMLLAKAEEIRQDLLNIPEVPQIQAELADGEMDFAQVLAGNIAEDVENVGMTKEDGGDMAVLAGSQPEDTGFTFEAVKKSGDMAQVGEDHADNKSSGSSAKTENGSMAEQFLNLVTDAAATDEVEFSQLSKSEQVRAVAEQILEKVRVVLSDTQTSMEISLTPESLGRVTLNLVSKHGALTAHFTAQNEIAKEAIESQMVVLRENLESQGLKVEAIEVTVSNFDFTQNGGAAADGNDRGGQQRNRRGISFEEAVGAESAAGMSEAEQIAADLMERNGNQVDYTA